MIASRGALRRIGWAALLAVCCALLFGLSLSVNALRSEVRRTEIRIVAVKREMLYLDTEFETRGNQQQLEAWNEVEFGYIAPTAGQYLENVRELAVLGKPAGPGAPAPIRVAAAAPSGSSAPVALPAIVSPLTGKPLGAEDDEEPAAPVDHEAAAAKLGERLGKVGHSPAPEAAARPAPSGKPGPVQPAVARSAAAEARP